MTPFMRALVAAAAALPLAACNYPHPPIPPSIPVPAGVFLSLGGASVVVEGVRLEGRLAEDGRGLTVQIYNESSERIRLLPDEWTLSADGESSPVFTGTAIRPKIGKRPIGTIVLAPGELHLAWVGMASRHKDKKPFRGAEAVTLSFVFEKAETAGKFTGVLVIPLSAERPI